ncbi:HesA/MoeB/ThiF family protein [Corynebacterium aquilae]|uniref:THIF-type NAD/FAD binding fold domain-containing protein n=1 Tax=Corynebacterium aquilae DSM 44791 TaxID=1431546 RepID=A0A1L7CD43_9CORY|nr:HesA/MoeB/ThiF family protein [Corynebacterium aquilae]APT83772.1 hypothetical protein CAQU_00220 [Corynebacterium aquilae DSM 44791]
MTETPNHLAGTPWPQPEPDTLSERELARTARQRNLPGFDDHAQRKLAHANILIVGAGGLGCPAATALVAAGVGRITLCDHDTVSLSNLHRQTLYRESDIGTPKAKAAARALAGLGPTAITCGPRLDASNATELLYTHDVVIDATDNFATRYLIADAAEITHTPLVWAAILQYQAQLAVFSPGHAHLRDIYPEPPSPGQVPSCAEAGVLGAATGVVGNMMAMEAIKLITGIAEPLNNTLLIYNALDNSTRTLAVAADDNRQPATDLAAHHTHDTITADELYTHAHDHPKQPLILLDVRTPEERATGSLLDQPAFAALATTAARRANSTTPIREVHCPLDELLHTGAQDLAGIVGVETPRGDTAACPAGQQPLLVLYCASGVRSTQALTALTEQTEALGISARSLVGGIGG